MANRNYQAEREEFGRRLFPPAMPHKLQLLRGPGSSNVILKDFCLAGPHPGSNTQEIVANLTPLLRAGVTTFVCLQPELPVAGAAHPGLRRDPSRTVAATAKPYIGEAQAIVDAGGVGFPQSRANGGSPLSFLHFPIPEHGPGVVPDAALSALALELVGHMRGGEYLYIHCGDGNGRSGTVGALLLGLVLGLSSGEALDLAQRSRNDRHAVGGSSPETHEQRSQVHRLLADGALRRAAEGVAPSRSNGAAAEAGRLLDSVLVKVRAACARKGPASLIHLHRYGLTLAGQPTGASTSSPSGNSTGVLSKAAFGRLVNDAEWYLQPAEAAALWTAALKATAAADAAAAAAAPGAASGPGGRSGASGGGQASASLLSSAEARFGVPTGYRTGPNALRGPMQHITAPGPSEPPLSSAAQAGSTAPSALVPGADYAGPLPEAPTVGGLFGVLRGQLPPKRASAVCDAFARLAASSGASSAHAAPGGSASAAREAAAALHAAQASAAALATPPAFVSLAALGLAFKPEGHPSVAAGRRSADSVRDEFFATFPPPSSASGSGSSGSGTSSSSTLSGGVGDIRGEGGGRSITLGDFAGYYAYLSALMPPPTEDAAFAQLLGGCWPGPTPPPGVGHSRRSDGYDSHHHHHGSASQTGADSRAGGDGPSSSSTSSSSGGLGGSVLEGLLRAVTQAEASSTSSRRGGGAPSGGSSNPLTDVLSDPRGGLPALLAAFRLHLVRCAASATAAHGRLAGSGLALTTRDLPPALRAAATGGAGGPAAALGSAVAGSGAGGGTGDLGVALLGAALRGADFDHDGRVSLLELRAALREAGAALPDVDSDLLFRVVLAATASGSSASGSASSSHGGAFGVDTSESRLDLEQLHALVRGAGGLAPARYGVAVQLWGALERNLASPAGPATTTGGGLGPTSGMRRPASGPPPQHHSASGPSSSSSPAPGSIPLGKLLLAFEAGAHPAVAAGRALPDAVARQFASAFGDGFRLADAHGPPARAAARGAPTPATAAYSGLGDGCVRLPFWLAFAESLSSAYPPGHEGDSAFAHTLFHVWAGGAGGAGARRGGRASSALSGASPLPLSEEGGGLLGGMGRLADARTGPGGTGYRRGQGLSNIAETPVGAPSSASSGAGGSGLDSSYAAYSSASASVAPASVGAVATGGYAGGHGGHAFIAGRTTGTSSFAPQLQTQTLTQTRPSTSGNTPPGSPGPYPGAAASSRGERFTSGGYQPRSPARVDHSWAPGGTGDSDLDSALAATRAALVARGRPAAYALIRTLEGASESVHGLPDVTLPLPSHALASALLHEASLPLSRQQLGALLGACAVGRAARDPEEREVSPQALLDLLLYGAPGGSLPPSRLGPVDRAFDALAARTRAPAHGDDGGPLLRLEDVRMCYASSAHPDVASGRRGEEAVLREFLSSFSGPTLVGEGGSVCRDQWRAFYASASLYEPFDAAFATEILRVWALHREPQRQHPVQLQQQLEHTGYGRRAAAPYQQHAQAPGLSTPRGGGSSDLGPFGGQPAPRRPVPEDPSSYRGQPAYHSQARTDLFRGLKAAGGYESILA